MALAEFPKDFVWGAATAAYQVEGAYDEGGKGESIWDRFTHMPGHVVGGDTGDVACDHYHRYKEDVALMRSLRLGAYRFSISWPRVFPRGGGRPNQAGLDFYNRLVESLMAADIEPFVTLYHWDLPQALQERGGWANRDTVRYFQEYAGEVVRRLGDRVTYWMTINEPWVVAFLGHETGVHAPGIRDPKTALQAAHHTLLAHGEAVDILRDVGGKDIKIGIVLNLSPVYPASERDADRAAARRYDGYLNRWFLDALYRGAYPEDMLEAYDRPAPRVEAGDMEVIRRKTDFLGVNHYFRETVRDDERGGLPRASAVRVPGVERTDMGWEIWPQGIYEILARVQKEYDPPEMYVTENGIVLADALDPQGKVQDDRRIQYTREYLLQVHGAMREGAKVRGYFHWSLMDNFEWAYGYSKRFGLVYVDFATQQRTVKKSGLWYRDVMSRNAVEHEE